MPFDIHDMPKRRLPRVVAIIVEGRGDGTCDVQGPLVTDFTNDHGSLNSAFFDLSANETIDQASGLKMEIRDHTTLNWGRGTGTARGAIILGMAVRRESNDAALARLGQNAPDARATWAGYIARQRRQDRETEESLQHRQEYGFGLGMPVRFG